MRPPDAPDKPTMLLLSHCLPDIDGDEGQRRAWRLLTLAGRTHRVCMAVIGQGRMHLSQWRQASAMADCIVIETPPTWRRGLASIGQIINGPAAMRLRHRGLFDRALQDWLQQRHFDAVWCTQPQLWPAIRSLRFALSICDMHAPPSRIQAQMMRDAGWRRRWRQRQWRLWLQWEQHIAARASIVTLADPADAHGLVGRSCLMMTLPTMETTEVGASETARFIQALRQGPTHDAPCQPVVEPVRLKLRLKRAA